VCEVKESSMAGIIKVIECLIYIIIFVVAGFYHSFKSRYTVLDQLLLQRLQGWDGCYLNSLMAGLKARSTMVMVVLSVG
jgi:hypothetical protein